ncbi:unnamed protein product [Ectocarpus sp. CCAP 1310/34]|nr:unnamed protein product [Ectocarpus sp. CCAP 1310/34]
MAPATGRTIWVPREGGPDCELRGEADKSGEPAAEACETKRSTRQFSRKTSA